MKRLLQLLVAVLVPMSLASGVALADPSCTISGTGPNSYNSCVDTQTNKTTITCTNDTDVVFINGQNSGSGQATVDGNTTGGNATSGNSSNNNNTTTNVSVSCAAPAAKTAPAAATTPTAAPTAPTGQGAVLGATTATPSAKSLPNTGSHAALTTTGIVAAVMGSVAVIAQLGVMVYRRILG